MNLVDFKIDWPVAAKIVRELRDYAALVILGLIAWGLLNHVSGKLDKVIEKLDELQALERVFHKAAPRE